MPAANCNYPFAMPPASADLATMWAFLEEGINHTMTTGKTADASYWRPMLSYTVVVNYCRISKMPEEGSSGSTGAKSRVDAEIEMRCNNLYNNLIQYFVARLKGLREKMDSLVGEALLLYYVEQWELYTTGANSLNLFFTDLNRFWVKRERQEGRKGVYPVYTLALDQWEQNIFLPLQQNSMSLTSTVLKLIEVERNGATIDQGLVKKVLDSLVPLGRDQTGLNKTCLDIYKEHFEVPFLNATEIYYKQESESFLAANDLQGYLKKVEERLQEEEDRVDAYLNPQTREALISKCRNVLICEHSDEMWEHSQSLRRVEDLQRMFSLLSLIRNGEEPLRKEFKGVVPERVGESVKNADMLDPNAYIDTAPSAQDS